MSVFSRTDQATAFGRCALTASSLVILLTACMGAQAPTSLPAPTPASPVPGSTIVIAPSPSGARAGSTPTGKPTSGVFNPATTTIRLEKVASGLNEPTDIVNAGDGSQRLFAVEKKGMIHIIKNDAVVPQPFLNITSLVKSSGSEQGLLGLAFHPNYKSNGQFFVNYTDQNGDSVVARYRVSSQPDVADPGSALQVLFVKQPYANHNGGNLLFGPDGYLYIGFGDGGSGGDPHGNGQNPDTLLGKMLRIDVDGGQPYAIPPTNPFANRAGYRPEIWALGLRNPWRYSFDRTTGDLYIADVGQDKYEEIDFQPSDSRGGENYGWNKMEGLHCFPDSAPCDASPFVQPIAEYGHRDGCSVTGGYVYRGAAQPQLSGAYFFADYCSGQFWALIRNAQARWTQTQLIKSSLAVSTFGQDEGGELYVAGLSDGSLYHLGEESH